MPIPSPKKEESQDKFIGRCMSALKDEFPDRKQRAGVCFSSWRKKHGGKKPKESIFSNIVGFETKETDSGDLIRGGYIATTHIDQGFFDENRHIYVKDRIAKETLEKWAREINAGNPRVNKVAVHHEWEPVVTGVGLKGTARVDRLPDNEYGLYVDSLIDKTKPDFEIIKDRLDKGLIDSFSIDFLTRDKLTGEYLPGAVVEQEVGEGIIRTLLPGTQLCGWSLASQPMNDNCVMIKEVLSRQAQDNKKFNKKEVIEMTEEVKKEIKEEAKEEKLHVVETKETMKPLSEEDLTLLKEAKERRAKEAKEAEYTKIVDKVKEELKESLKKVKVENKVSVNKGTECKELVEYKEAIKAESKLSISSQFKLAGKMADLAGLTDKGYVPTSKTAAENRRFDFEIKKVGCKYLLEHKALGLTTNQNTDTDYLLSAAELSDVFDPVIYNMLNQATVTWNILAKDDYSNKGNNQVQFTGKTAANTTASFYTGTAVTTGNVTRLKFMTKFKKAQAGIEVDGDMIAAARGGPVGDVFAQEVKDSTDDLLATINAALFAEVGLETAAGVIGFEYITDSAGNTTLYNLTRSTTNLLSPASAGDTYIDGSSADITISNLRKAKRQAIKEGAKIENLVFITDHVQGDKFRGIYDAAQRQPPTSTRWGFEGRPAIDGIPIFEDKDCNDDDWFLVDLETHRIAIWVPPTLEMLGKDADSRKGFIKTYFATYNRAPRRMVQIYSNATT